MDQLFIALFGLTAIYLGMGNWQPGRKWAPIIGLCGQPFWFYFAWQTGGWGILLLTVAYTAVYTRGAWVQWRPTAPVVAECGHPVSLMLRSAETGKLLYCELCDARSGRRDAEVREAELVDEVNYLTAALRESGRRS